MKKILLAKTLFMLALFTAAPAMAQYKNNSFGADAGFWSAPVKGSITEAQPAGILKAPDNRGIRLQLGGRVAFEWNQKLDLDRWWLSIGSGLGLLSFTTDDSSGNLEQQFDAEASDALGTILQIMAPRVGVRYFFMTDRFRPYLQLGASFSYLLSLNNRQSDCDGLCAGRDNLGTYLPHQALIGLHVQPGFEWVVAPDMALHFTFDTQVWLPINAEPHFSLVPSVGFLFFVQ